MAYTVPTFNLTAKLWRVDTGLVNPPDLTFLAQLRVTPRALQGQMDWEQTPVPEPYPQTQFFSVLLCCPKLTDIRGPGYSLISPFNGDWVEVAHTGWIYSVVQVEDVAKGFPNEYRLAQLHIAYKQFPMD